MSTTTTPSTAAAGEPDPYERAVHLIRTELGGVVISAAEAADVPLPRSPSCPQGARR